MLRAPRNRPPRRARAVRHSRDRQGRSTAADRPPSQTARTMDGTREAAPSRSTRRADDRRTPRPFDRRPPGRRRRRSFRSSRQCFCRPPRCRPSPYRPRQQRPRHRHPVRCRHRPPKRPQRRRQCLFRPNPTSRSWRRSPELRTSLYRPTTPTSHRSTIRHSRMRRWQSHLFDRSSRSGRCHKLREGTEMKGRQR
jgi:hypothetical protein